MREILIIGGTTEGRKLSECLAGSGVAHTLCVATEYGELVLTPNPLVKVHRGRMDREEMRSFILAGNFAAVVDATHPYARVVTENVKQASGGEDIPYLRLKRDTGSDVTHEKMKSFVSSQACALALTKTEGNILLTTGSKELPVFCAHPSLKERLYVRVLPGMDSLRICEEQGISGKQILALQGPFTQEMNEAMLRQYQIRHLVTKKSGRTGGYEEKLEAAERVDIPVYVIGQETEEEGCSFMEVLQKLEQILDKKLESTEKMKIFLVGVGMGNPGSLTEEAGQTIETADLLFGAERMLEPYQPRLEKKPFYMASQIIPYLEELQKKDALASGYRVAVLFSGDTGFYSGCSALYEALQKEIADHRLEAQVQILPGISSVAYLASRLGESYQDAWIASLHGKDIPDLGQRLKENDKIFLLLSGVKDVNRLGKMLTKEGLSRSMVYLGYRLSYPEEQILSLSPKACCELKQEGLYCCFIKNPQGVRCRKLTPGKKDGEFIRGKVPMTKEEVREISLCKLQLQEGDVVYDVGSGTGSIAVEVAELSPSLQVIAIEQKEEALDLLSRNIEKFGLHNVKMVQAKAPSGFENLPVPDCAFIGGSGGKLKEILAALYAKNPHMRIVINAISLETICEIKEIQTLYPMVEDEIIQVQVNRSKSIGAYHLMEAENPVWICAFTFREEAWER